MKRVATIILNRNLPLVTDKLYEHLVKYDSKMTDVYVVEAGSEEDQVSKYMSWHAKWPEANTHGLRFSRGMNYGLSQLWYEKKFNIYDAFFLITNDTLLSEGPTISKLINIIDNHPRVGILSPCGFNWGERFLLKENCTKYFWFVHNNALMLRRELIQNIMNYDEPNFMNFIFDGNNFRGYGSESELVAKAYANDWATAITTNIFVGENESYLINNADLIKTEKYEENLKLYIEEGQIWMRNKYGFNSHWTMQQYVKGFYDKFFNYHPEYISFKI
jgi:hypothetical protein